MCYGWCLTWVGKFTFECVVDKFDNSHTKSIDIVEIISHSLRTDGDKNC